MDADSLVLCSRIGSNNLDDLELSSPLCVDYSDELVTSFRVDSCHPTLPHHPQKLKEPEPVELEKQSDPENLPLPASPGNLHVLASTGQPRGEKVTGRGSTIQMDREDEIFCTSRGPGS